jgi:UDP-N-acetylglucosamine acyltransferase
VGTVIHPSAIVDKSAIIGSDVRIGPYSVVESDVEIGDGCDIGPHVLLNAGTRMGKGCRIFKGASLGAVPQDLKFGGEKTLLRIGDNTTVREFCTLNRGTKETGETVIGSNCLFMAYCHVGHDCRIGNNLIAANCMNLAGHVEIGKNVNVGGMSAVVQFRRIGDYSHITAFSLIKKDVAPFAMIAPGPMRLIGINRIGLARAGFDHARRDIIKRAYRILFRSMLTTGEALARLSSEFPDSSDVQSLITFVKTSKRGLHRVREATAEAESADD